MPTPTNEDLAKQIEKVDLATKRRHKSMMTTINKFKAEVTEQLQPFHDYLVGIEAIEKDSSKKTAGGAISIDPRAAELIKWLIIIILIIAGFKFTQP